MGRFFGVFGLDAKDGSSDIFGAVLDCDTRRVRVHSFVISGFSNFEVLLLKKYHAQVMFRLNRTFEVGILMWEELLTCVSLRLHGFKGIQYISTSFRLPSDRRTVRGCSEPMTSSCCLSITVATPTAKSIV